MQLRSPVIGILAGALVALAGARVAPRDGDPIEAAYAKLAPWAEPGPMHARLAPLVGDFELTIRWRAAPEQEWAETRGRATRAWILDGRFLEERLSCSWGERPFEGRGLLGFDAFREEFVSIWLDTASTWPMVGSAPAGPDPRVVSTVGTAGDPASGERDAWFRTVLRITSPDEQVRELWSRDSDGGEFKAGEIRYVRG